VNGSESGILLVDDRVENLVALEAILEPLGERLVRATSGDEALKHLLTDDFAVILLDVQMPGMDGFETATSIKQRDRTRHVPIIFITAMSREIEHSIKGYSAGAVDYIYKPVDPDILRAKVRVFVDLSRMTKELERQREELAAKTLELERSNADLDQFASVASHDLQEPLRVIAGYLELLTDQAGDSLDENAQAWVERASSAAGRMSALIRDLLTYARAGASAEHKPTDLNEALQVALDNLAVTVAETGAEIVAGELPMVLGAPSELSQVFQNVLSNAIKFRGDEAPRIHVDAAGAGARFVVSIQDNGIGIPPDKQEQVFSMFERVDRNAPGTGVGLAVCKRIVERSGGRIWIEPGVPGGTVVRFSLPGV
jgi:two-component system, sensor histidine kinase and response regulator